MITYVRRTILKRLLIIFEFDNIVSRLLLSHSSMLKGRISEKVPGSIPGPVSYRGHGL